MLLKLPVIRHIIHRNTAGLRPYLDFNARLANKQKFEQNISRRKWNVDLNELHLLWSTYRDVSQKKCDLEQKRRDIWNSIQKLLDSKSDQSEALIEKLKIERVMARKDFQALKENSYALEESFIHKFLDLPNDIHERTPLETDQVHYSQSDHPVKTSTISILYNETTYMGLRAPEHHVR